MNTLYFLQTLRRTLALLVASCAMVTGVSAQTLLPNSDASTATFAALCQNRADIEAQNFCFGFGEGVYQSFLMQQSHTTKPTVCMPKGLTRDAVLTDFLVWTGARPQHNGDYAAKTIIRFLTSRYPCSKTQ